MRFTTNGGTRAVEAAILGTLVKLAVPAMVGSIAEVAVGKLRGWISAAADTLGEPDLKSDTVMIEVQRRLKEARERKKRGQVLEVADVDMARWYEILEQDWARSEKLRDPETLIRHLYLELLFASWFEEWGGWELNKGYKLFTASAFMEHRADVYVKAVAGREAAEMIVNFVCDDLPSTNRVVALFASLEGNPPTGGVPRTFVLATHAIAFSGAASNYIRRRSQARDYSVIMLSAGEIDWLKKAHGKAERWKRLQEKKL